MRLGTGAKCTVLKKKLKPSITIAAKYPNFTANERLQELEVVRLDYKRVSKERKLVVILKHDVFQDEEIYAVPYFVHVDEEGPEEGFFAIDEKGKPTLTPASQAPAAEVNADGTLRIPDALLRAVIRPDDPGIQNAINMLNLNVDDDNEPAPENIPTPNRADNRCTYANEWKHDGTCFRRSNNHHRSRPKLTNVTEHMKLSKLQMFELLFPTKFVKETMIPQMNKILVEGNAVGGATNYEEFLAFLGIILRMSSSVGIDRSKYWSKPDNKDKLKTKFNPIMSRKRFDALLNASSFTDKEPPTYKDRFWEIRDLLHAWNMNMTDEFVAGWVVCLDESMSKWVNQYTCPGFMVVPRKPWPFGNEYHSIVCGLCDIMFKIELVEGKDEPPQRPPLQHSEKGKTAGLMLRLTKDLVGRGTVVVLDSGFCVLEGIIELRKKGIYAQAVIKKRRYWPRYIEGDEVIAHFEGKDPGTFDAKKGALGGHEFYLYCMKEPDYTSMFMTTYGTAERVGVEQVRVVKEGNSSETFRFQYPEVLHMHYSFRDAVDNHNGRRMFPVAIEEEMKTTRWPFRVFQFLLGITEVNCHNALHYFQQEQEMSQIDFRDALSDELIDQFIKFKSASGEARPVREVQQVYEHELVALKKNQKFAGTQIVYTRSVWPTWKCCEKEKRVRTYCICSPGIIRCLECYVEHRIRDDRV